MSLGDMLFAGSGNDGGSRRGPGLSPKVVGSERLGHASITLTLDTYQHVLPDMQDAAAEKLEAMFGGK